jgi:hypothetical protein
MGGAIGPEGPPCLPQRAKALIVRHRVLDNERLDPFRVGKDHAKTHGAAIVLHVERIAREPERFGEAYYDLSTLIERIGELLRVRPVTVSEARIVRRDKMIAVGQPGKERFEHPR